MKCPACRNVNKASFIKESVPYYVCLVCETCYCDRIDQSNKVGGEGEGERNNLHNPSRIERFKSVNAGSRILDYGCGSGLFVSFAKEQQLDAFGYDPYSSEFNKMPKGEFDIVSMVEVIEHLTYPFTELDIVKSKLRNNGLLYIETSFSDMFKGRELCNVPYIAPVLGHQTIFSYFGLFILMALKGFRVYSTINQNSLFFLNIKS